MPTKKDLFTDNYLEKAPPEPFEIDWSPLSKLKIAFLDTWLRNDLRHDSPQSSRAFLNCYLGQDVNTKSLYETAFLKKKTPKDCPEMDSNTEKYLTYLKRAFSKFYDAVCILDKPLDLFKFFAHWEYFIEPDHENYKKIDKFQLDGGFPFAFAVYETMMASKYFNRPRGLKDLNMMRFVSIFQDYPYTFGGLSHMMTEQGFELKKKEVNGYAEYNCHFIISILKALGFKDNYRESPQWNDHFLTQELVQEINTREKLYLPISFYALLFNKLYGTQFEKIHTTEDNKHIYYFFNLGFIQDDLN